MNEQLLAYLFVFISGLFICLAAIMNATMDETDHHFDQSIFKNMFKKAFFGIEWNLWAGQDQMWRNKYIDRDPEKGLRKDKILFFTANWVQLYDIWHFSKMWMICFFILGTMFSVFAVKLNFDYTNWVSYVELVAMFIYYGLCWNVTFNLFYNTVLKRKEFRK